jgi:hypothetical protein
MLHRAYAPLAAAGLNYTAATQEEETTGKRLQSASLALVARLNGTVAGTIAYYDRQKFQGGPVWFGRDEVCIFAQFGSNRRCSTARSAGGCSMRFACVRSKTAKKSWHATRR